MAAKERPFHWTTEFPEVFYDESGAPLADGGFDVILGNPPWEMLRGEGLERAGLTAFVKGSGHYKLQGDGHANLYQLFVERGLRLLRRSGSCGLILPAGFASDQGSSALRRHLFERTVVRTFTTIDNAEGLFPIHRGLKFLLLTFSMPGRTSDVPVRSGVRFVDALDRIADCGTDPDALSVPRALLDRVSGESLAVPELRTEADVRILSAVSAGVPALSDADGWRAQFGRELNATDDRPHFNECGSGMPVIEGKQVVAFRAEVNRAKYWIAPDVAATLVDAGRTFSRARLAYRDVASASNRMTLIAAIVPPRTLTTHTLFCLKTALDEDSQLFLCGVLNSYVANYLVRMRVTTHVTASIMSRLPVPRPARAEPRFAAVVRDVRALAHGEDPERLAGLNAAVASLYDLTAGGVRARRRNISAGAGGGTKSGAPAVPRARHRRQRVSFPFSVTHGVMKQKRGRLQLGIIWGLVAGLAVLQGALWSLAGTGPDTAAVLYLVAGWVVVLSLAVLASRGIGTLTERLAARETAHRATLDEVQQLQTQNAMLQIVARSVDVALTFQALAVRIARLVRLRSGRAGAAQ